MLTLSRRIAKFAKQSRFDRGLPWFGSQVISDMEQAAQLLQQHERIIAILADKGYLADDIDVAVLIEMIVP